MIPFHRAVIWPIVISIFLGSLALGAEAIPTVADARQLYADGKYTEVVRAVSKIVKSHDWQAQKPDAFELYTLKAEAHLRSKESVPAASSFDLAAKAAMDQAAVDKAAADKAASANTDALIARWNADRAQAARARATAYLIRHSIGTNFIPKATADERVAGGKPEDHIKIDIVQDETRKQALTALWTDEKNASAARLATATNAENKSVQVLLDALPVIGPLRDVDLAANGSDDDTRKITAVIAQHAVELLQPMIEKMPPRVDEIAMDAMAVEVSYLGQPNGTYLSRWRRHGMEGKQQFELQEMVAKSKKIGVALQIFMDGLPAERDLFDKVSRDVRHVHDTAEKILTTNYTKTFATKDAAME